jgi:glycosyltransferase involved in cell wall biosynthesis
MEAHGLQPVGFLEATFDRGMALDRGAIQPTVPLRLLHVAGGNLYGGVERMLVTIARHQAPNAGARHEFAVCFPGRLREELEAAGESVHDLGPARFSRPWTVFCARRNLRRLMQESDTDCVVFHGCWPLAALGWRKANTACCTLLWVHNAVNGGHWVERLGARRHLDHFVANSHWTYDLAHRWRPRTQGTVICCPVDLPSQPLPRSGRVRREFGVGDETIVVVQVSRLELGKGHRFLIEAARVLESLPQSPPWEIWFVGGPQRPAEQAYQRSLLEMVANFRLEHRIRWLGQRSDVDVVLADADVFCQPNVSPESLGLVFLEAMAQGLPIVSSDFGGAREIVPALAGLLVPPGDTAALTRVLEQLIADPGVRSRLKAAGPGHARRLADPAARLTDLEALVGRIRS